MIRKLSQSLVFAAFVQSLSLPALAAMPGLPPPPTLTQSPWNGDWVLSNTRNNSEMKESAAEGYRFHLAPDGQILWEIPSLHETVKGRTDGKPMDIHRPKPSNLTLAVTREGDRVLMYKVSRNGVPEGEGRMTLVDHDRAWIDISQPAGRPDLAAVIIYVRPSAAQL